MIDKRGFRLGVAIIIVNQRNKLFWARRVGRTGWQFPQGGLLERESIRDGMFRELYEEVGLTPDDVTVIAESKRWLYYYLPRHLLRHHSRPLCIGQKQKWFLLRLKDDARPFSFTHTDMPEFDGFRWVNYWYPLRQVVFFKRKLYKRALSEFVSYLFKGKNDRDQQC